jgi:bifunctional UDP-N-acetylglucosamine pyrophosphorylase/glucosamine-1-phosphate N-acetyltransferase
MPPLPPTAVVLAAGLGTRMRSPLAKVLHPLLGRPMLGWVLDAVAGMDPILVTHHQAGDVEAAFPGVRVARQEAPRGTGDAVRAALHLLPERGPVVVIAGDTPLVTRDLVARLLEAHRSTWASHGGPATVASFHAEDPTGYGRIVRAGGTRIVEEAHCTPEERAIHEVNSGLYVFDAAWLREAVPRIVPHPPKEELYLTDLVGTDTTVVAGFAEQSFLGVNDRAALAEARALLRRRVNRAWAAQGVDFADLVSCHVDATVTLHAGAVVGFGAVIEGSSEVHGEVGPYAIVKDSFVAPGARVLAHSVLDGARVEAGAVAGPFARLRPGAEVGEGAHVGNFVEMKAARLGRGAKANHLTYLGDAEVGAGANIGAGTITCNYDGVRKHRTTIGAGAFIGSNAALVAPVTIGAGAIVGAGSTVTEDVPDDAIAVARPPLKVTVRSAERLRARLKARA